MLKKKSSAVGVHQSLLEGVGFSRKGTRGGLRAFGEHSESISVCRRLFSLKSFYVSRIRFSVQYQ